MALLSRYHLRCRTCAFLVHDQYFADKKRFQAGICPNDAGVVEVVQPFTSTVVRGVHVETNPESNRYGHVVEEAE